MILAGDLKPLVNYKTLGTDAALVQAFGAWIMTNGKS
jgi:hypothetical protein